MGTSQKSEREVKAPPFAKTAKDGPPARSTPNAESKAPPFAFCTKVGDVRGQRHRAVCGCDFWWRFALEAWSRR
jgi:hypothetical protein